MRDETARIAKESFDIEAQVIRNTCAAMDWKAFAKAVGLISRACRIAVSGCGHTGIACRHFAHSLCCVERPARFLSPSEAVHGGTGFIQKDDVLVTASRGGKTAELLPIIAIAKRKGTAVITVTENLSSEMAKNSDIALPIHVFRETDRFNTQGTGSFVAVTAVFDALQVAVMEETGFRLEQFALTHPGGAVGQRLNG